MAAVKIFEEQFGGTAMQLQLKTPDLGHSWSAVWQDTVSNYLNVNGTGDATATGTAGGGFIYTANNNGGTPYNTPNYYVQTKVTTLPGTDGRPLFL
ncbi:MAG TPA: hypothetical protein VEA58_11565, partial [Anaerovoracaceae bacterium]|nr:hypothetical protein [Anaerovoracaceae bacterium]